MVNHHKRALTGGFEPKGYPLSRLRNHHKGQTALVLGTGPSMREVYEWAAPHFDFVVGVNRVCYEIQCDYLLVIDRSNRFDVDKLKQGKFRQFVTSHQMIDQWLRHFPELVEFYGLPCPPGTKLDAWDGVCRHGWLPQYNGSPYCATALASFLGASKVILGGVDYVGAHNWSRDKRPEKYDKANRAFADLVLRCREEGTEVVNASKVSRLTTVPKV